MRRHPGVRLHRRIEDAGSERTTTTATTAATGPSTTAPEPARRIAAVLAIVLEAATVVLVAVGLRGDLVRVLLAPVLILLMTATAWIAVTRRHVIRIAATTATAGLLVVLAAIVLTGEGHGIGLLVTVALLAASAGLVRFALRRDRRALRTQPVPGTPVRRAKHGVLLMNPQSGGGKAAKARLAEECGKRGIEPIVLQPGDDLLALARTAIERGADVIGMAGGDGSQAVVAGAAIEADVPLVCVPAGTRNHFALDLGLDRDDVVAALDAFDDGASERRIDVAEVNGRLFVNNVSLGLYASIVQSPDYRHAKRKTTTTMLADLVGPDAEPFDLHLVGPDGKTRHGDRIIEVSNNPYVLTSITGFGGRARLDTGRLGVAAAEVRGAGDITAFVAGEWLHRLDHFDGWTEWTTDHLTVESAGPVAAAIDGEAMQLDPPLEFRIRPGALRVRLPASAPGYAPAALRAPSPWWTFTALLRAAAGRPTPIEESQR